jgi:hypothetical protein
MLWLLVLFTLLYSGDGSVAIDLGLVLVDHAGSGLLLILSTWNLFIFGLFIAYHCNFTSSRLSIMEAILLGMSMFGNSTSDGGVFNAILFAFGFIFCGAGVF